MSDTISRQAAIDALKEKVFSNLTDEFSGAMQVLDELEPADVVPVVRCEDCKRHSFDAGYGNYWCNLTSGVRKVKPDDFCSYGERKE